ncbi:MAG: response regulator [Leptospiraceae bacterium]|nr:response regulator [Leptospiraceae bacterium]
MNRLILLVEDEPSTALTTSKLLEFSGFQVVHAATGEDAVQFVKDHSDIHLVLMDIDLGSGIDGTQAAAIILAHRDLPLVFLSSHTEEEIVQKTEGITSYGYIVKNSGKTVLLASIKMAFKLFEAKISEQQKEKALRDSEEFLSAIYHYNESGIYLIRVEDDGRCVYEGINPVHEKLTGITNEEVVGKSPDDLADFFGPQVLAYIKGLYAECIQSKQAVHSEFEVPEGDLKGWWYSRLTPIVDEVSGKVIRIIGSSFMVTKLKNLEQKHEALMNRYNSLVSSLGAAVETEVDDLVSAARECAQPSVQKRLEACVYKLNSIRQDFISEQM